MNTHFPSRVLQGVTVVGLLITALVASFAADSAQADSGWTIDVAHLGEILIVRAGEGAPKVNLRGQTYAAGQSVYIDGQSLRIIAMDDRSVTFQRDREFARIANSSAGTSLAPEKLPPAVRLTTPEAFQREVARLLAPGMQVRLEPADASAPGLVIQGRVTGDGERAQLAQEFLARLQARIREDFPGASASFRTLGDDAKQKDTNFTMWLSPDAREPQRADELLQLFR